jgi:hypothetical protein
MHADWKAAKKGSEDNFKKAYEGWVANETAKAKGGDKKAQQKVLAESLKKCGLDQGPKYTNYLKFDEGFGKQLDKLEKMVDDIAAADKQVDKLKLADVLKNRKLRGTFQHYCQNQGRISEVYNFVVEGIKMKLPAVYSEFIQDGAPQRINIDGDEVAEWEACEESGNWKPAEAYRKALLKKMVDLLGAHVPICAKHKVYRKHLAQGLCNAELHDQIETVRTTATNYARDVQGYSKRWKDVKPDFWTVLNVTLNDILAEVDKVENA